MLAALLLLIFIGCNEHRPLDVTVSDIDNKKEEKVYRTDTAALPGTRNEKEKEEPGENARIPNTEWEKKIIKTATLNLEVKDYDGYYRLLYATVKRIGGYVVQEEQSQSDYKTENAVTIRVPVTQFDEALSLVINGTGQEKLNEKKITSEDVTGEVVDTKSRLEAKRQVRLRYLELLKQAKNMEEILQVQNEINELQEQIELATGRSSYLTQSSAYSTIHLTFFQVLNPAAGTEPQPGFFIKFVAAFLSGFDFVIQLILGLVSIWPLLIILAGIWLGFRKWKLSKVKPG